MMGSVGPYRASESLRRTYRNGTTPASANLMVSRRKTVNATMLICSIASISGASAVHGTLQMERCDCPRFVLHCLGCFAAHVACHCEVQTRASSLIVIQACLTNTSTPTDEYGQLGIKRLLPRGADSRLSWLAHVFEICGARGFLALKLSLLVIIPYGCSKEP